jgi:hypothetical protein
MDSKSVHMEDGAIMSSRLFLFSCNHIVSALLTSFENSFFGLKLAFLGFTDSMNCQLGQALFCINL